MGIDVMAAQTLDCSVEQKALSYICCHALLSPLVTVMAREHIEKYYMIYFDVNNEICLKCV